MNLTNDKSDIDVMSKPQIEQLQKKKQEYYLLGSFIRKRGQKVFYRNPQNDEIGEVNIKFSDTVHLIPKDGKLIPVDLEFQKCMVDSRYDFFYAMCLRTAKERFKKYKEGKIDKLCNLIPYNPEGIKLF